MTFHTVQVSSVETKEILWTSLFLKTRTKRLYYGQYEKELCDLPKLEWRQQCPVPARLIKGKRYLIHASAGSVKFRIKDLEFSH